MSPGKFEWAKEFLSSDAVRFLEGKNGLIEYSLPRACPVNENLMCISDTSELDE
jgi:hypothetical protein